MTSPVFLIGSMTKRWKIRYAIIDKDVKIPARTRIGYDLKEDKKRFEVSKNGVVIIPKGMVIKSD